MFFFGDFLFWIIILSVIGSIFTYLVPMLFAYWMARNAWNSYQVYNAQMEAALRELAMAMLMGQSQQMRAYEQAMRAQVNSLPRTERVVYQQKLNDVVNGRKVLNPTTGEWETG